MTAHLPVLKGHAMPPGDEQLVLWRPGSTRREVRPGLRTMIRPNHLLALTVGTAGIVLGFLTAVGPMVIANMALVAWTVAERAYTWLAHDPELDRRPGHQSYRSDDFAGLPPATVHFARRILAAAHTVDTTPATCWLADDLRATIHQVAWDALDYLYHVHPYVNGMFAQSQDSDLVRIASRLEDCATLVTEWHTKLSDLDQLTSAVRHDLPRVAAIAEDACQQTWATITAARDITNAGVFPWETPHNPGSRPRDAGSVSVMVAVLIPALLFVLALVVDGSARLRAIARADALAAEAARAANTAVDTRSPSVGVDTATVARAAADYLARAGHPGQVTIAGARAVRVTVTVTAPTTIGLLGDSTQATGTALAQLGVGTRDGGLP
ncbi:hypothetical protein [Amycolatopsis nigrescens]|uniref:hypothetical protein n=1 Tax=Amycolatopsis nigrescens TaxID=381445 RepID=UPI00035D0F76|nr:hypothetical protein [Amycolatopsis nigrescens]